jgi:hypothetical protein
MKTEEAGMKKFAALLALLFLVSCIVVFAEENGEDAPAGNEPVVGNRLIPHTDFFSPSLRAGLINTFEDGNHYFGGGMRINLVSSVPKGDDDDFRGPAFIDWFVEVNLYRDPDLLEWAFDYLMGITVSVERARPGIRDWLLPYYGIKLGGIYLSDGQKSGVAFLPFIGLSILRRRYFFLDLEVAVLLNSADFKGMVSYEPSLAFGFSY